MRKTALEAYHHSAGCKTAGIDGVTVPVLFTSLEQEVHALRTSTAISDISCIALLRISGEHTFNLLDRVCPCFLFIKTNQMKHTLLLTEEGIPFADIYLCKEEKDYIVMGKGLPADEFKEWLLKHTKLEEEIEIEVLNETHSLIGLNGPFSWDLLAELEDPEIISVPYMSFYRPDDNRMIFRAGETGEFGYFILVPNDQAGKNWEDIIEMGERFDLERAGFDALDYCSLENMFFNIRKEGSIGATPAELQLQWRISYRKKSVYSNALQKMKGSTLARRITALISEAPLQEKQKIYFKDENIGYIVNANPFISGNSYIGLAMIDIPYAVSGVPLYRVESESERYAVKTISPPFVNNRSLYVDPQVHAYVDVDTISFPPLDCTCYE